MSRISHLTNHIDNLEYTIMHIKAKLSMLQPSQLVYILENTTNTSQDKYPEMLESIITRVKNNQIISNKQKDVLINMIVHAPILEQEECN